MTISLPGRRLAIVLALALSMATAVLLLALSPQTMAQARKPACPSSSTAHPKRGVHTCARSGHTPRSVKSPHKGRSHARPKIRGHHSKHAVGKKTETTKKKTSSPVGASQTTPTCEDGSGPVRASDGSFSCADGSEALCENGADATASSDGSTLVCGVDSGDDSGSGEAACEDGSIPIPASDGSISCADGSEPA